MISPIETNGMISRAQDISAIRHNEENRGALDHMNIQNKMEAKQEQEVRTVHEADNGDKTDTHHDAKEKGRNEYINLRKSVKKKQANTQEKVVAKGVQGFDVKI